MRGRAEAARKAHNLEVGGSSPPPATLKKAYSKSQITIIYSVNSNDESA